MNRKLRRVALYTLVAGSLAVGQAAAASSVSQRVSAAAVPHATSASCPTAMPDTTTVAYGMNNGGSGYKPSHVSMSLWKACDGSYYASATVFKASDGWYFKADASKPGFLAGNAGLTVSDQDATTGRNSCTSANKSCDSQHLTPKGVRGDLFAIGGTFHSSNGVFDSWSTDYFTNTDYTCEIGQSGPGIPQC